MEEWYNKLLNEKDPVILTHAAIANARKGVAGTGKAVVSLLAKVDFTKLTEPQQLDLLRAIELNFIRLGDPDTETKKLVSAALSPSYPAKTNSLNRELSKLLVYIDAPKAVEKTMALLASAKDDAPAQKSISESSISSPLL